MQALTSSAQHAELIMQTQKKEHAENVGHSGLSKSIYQRHEVQTCTA